MNVQTRLRAAAVLLACMVLSGCAGLRSAAGNLQALEAASKAESQQAQRVIVELRTEVLGLQRDLGAARAAQARLEGELREAQRRLAEAQRQVSAQREDLARAREEREKAVQAGREAQGQLIELGKLRQQVADAERGQARLQALEAAVEKQTQDMADLKAATQRASGQFKSKLPSAEFVVPPKGSLGRAASAEGPAMASPRTIIVQPGDTLWDLARKHRVDLLDLITINRLVDNRIMPGQELLLPGSPAE